MMKFYITLLILASGSFVWQPVQSEVITQKVSDDNTFVMVRDEAWQPENFENGSPVPATYVKQASITLDGKDDEPEWVRATEATVPLAFGNAKEASVKAIYTDEEVFIRVRWADSTEDRNHHPWVWDSAEERYVSGPQTEDSVMLSFEAGCEWNPSLLSGRAFDFDGWQWLAARSDPVGQAWDLMGAILDTDQQSFTPVPYQSRETEVTWNIKFDDYFGELSHQDWSELDRRYLLQPVNPMVYYHSELDQMKVTDVSKQLPAPQSPPSDDTEEVFPQFQAVKLEGDAGEVGAKGHWQDGFWTVEFRRVLRTPSKTLNDTVFSRLTQFSLHVFDHVEQLDQSSESQRLFLQFLEKEPSPESEPDPKLVSE